MQSYATDQFSQEQALTSSEHYHSETAGVVVNCSSGTVSSYQATVTDNVEQSTQEPTRFLSHFTGTMELHADAQTVTKYLDAHHGWFCRCAHPMQVNPLGDNGYTLTIGRFGSFGYEVEPKISLDLLPQDQGVYRIRTISMLDSDPQGYEVDFQAALQLSEVPINRDGIAEVSQSKLTRVEWHLNLAVEIQFPRFIQKLPKGLIQQTGDRLLAKIVQQVSQRLTAKVQDDFHATLGLSTPKQSRKKHFLTALKLQASYPC